MVTYAIHIIVCLDTHTYHSPCFHGTFAIGKNRFILLLSIHNSFARLRKKHDSIRFRSTRIFYFRLKKRHRVNIISRFRFKHIQMKMRTERISGVSAPCNLLTSLYRIFSRFGNNLHFPALFFILELLHPFGNGRNKITQMAVDS